MKNPQNSAKNIHIFAFRAIDHPDLSQAFYKGQCESLSHYGIKSLKSSQQDWMRSPYVYCIAAKDLNTGQLIGGLRLHIRKLGHYLPMQTALGEQDSAVYELIDENDTEACGLWITKKSFKPKKLIDLFSIAMISLNKELEVKRFYMFSAPHTLDVFKKFGSIEDHRFGEQGNYHYPTKDYLSTVIYFELANATVLAKNALETFENLTRRKDPFIRFSEQNYEVAISVQYPISKGLVKPNEVSASVNHQPISSDSLLTAKDLHKVFEHHSKTIH